MVAEVPEFTQAGLEVKKAFVRLHLTFGSWVKGHVMLILQSSSEIWRTQPSTASLGLPGQTDDVQVPLSQARTPVTQSKALPWSQETMLPSSSSWEKKQAVLSASGPVWGRPVQRGEASVHTHTQLHNVHSAIWGQDRPQLYSETPLEFRFQVNKRTQRFKYH